MRYVTVDELLAKPNHFRAHQALSGCTGCGRLKPGCFAVVSTAESGERCRTCGEPVAKAAPRRRLM